MNILVVIAHPDDEIIWCGEFLRKLIKNKNHIRCKEFITSSQNLGYNPILLPNEDKGPDTIIESPLGINMELDIIYKNKKDRYDLIITHSPTGEEGANLHHIQTHYESIIFSHKNKIPIVFFSSHISIEKKLAVHIPLKKSLIFRGKSLVLFAKIFYYLKKASKTNHNSFSSTIYFFIFIKYHFLKTKIFTITTNTNSNWKKKFIAENYNSLSSQILKLKFIESDFEFISGHDRNILVMIQEHLI